MNLGKKEGIVVVGEIQKREIMPLTLELIGAAGKLSKERNLSLSVILSGCGIKEEAKKLYNYGVDEILCIEDEKLIEGHMQQDEKRTWHYGERGCVVQQDIRQAWI